jgi:hypothetical protein
VAYDVRADLDVARICALVQLSLVIAFMACHCTMARRDFAEDQTLALIELAKGTSGDVRRTRRLKRLPFPLKKKAFPLPRFKVARERG